MICTGNNSIEVTQACNWSLRLDLTSECTRFQEGLIIELEDPSVRIVILRITIGPFEGAEIFKVIYPLLGCHKVEGRTQGCPVHCSREEFLVGHSMMGILCHWRSRLAC